MHKAPDVCFQEAVAGPGWEGSADVFCSDPAEKFLAPMRQGQNKAYGSISFVEHSIPDASVTAYLCGKVYYHHQEHIYSYELSSRSHTRLYRMERCSRLFIVRSILCAVHANTLVIFEREPRELRLKEVPLKIIQSNEGQGNRDGIGFLYEDSIEIFSLGKYPIQVVDIPQGLKIIDFANAEDATYILDEQGRVLKTKSIFLTRQIISAEPLLVIPETARVHNGILACDSAIFLTVVSETEGSIWIEKYEIGDSSLTLLYSFTSRFLSGIAIKDEFLLGECMIHLSNAPILVLRDRVYNAFQLGDNEWIGVSTGKIYFIEEARKLADNKLSYEMPSHRFVINPNEIEVPDFIKDQRQIDHFLRNETLLRGCEAILDQVKSISGDMERRQGELDAQRIGIRTEMEKIERRKRAVEERIYVLLSRARRVQIKGSTEGFYRKTKALEEEMERVDTKDMLSLKERLKAQRAVLRGKRH